MRGKSHLTIMFVYRSSFNFNLLISFKHSFAIIIYLYCVKYNKHTTYLPPQGFGPEAKTRGGTLGFPACIHVRNSKCKKVSTVSKFVSMRKKSRFDQTRRARSSRVIFQQARKVLSGSCHSATTSEVFEQRLTVLRARVCVFVVL